MYNYTDDELREIIENYKKTGDSETVNRTLKFWACGDIPDYDKEIVDFLDEIIHIAKKYGHGDIVALCTELGNQMKKTSGNAFAYTSVLQDALVSKNECIILLKECLENGRYQAALTKIIEFIKQKKDFGVAYEVLKTIDIFSAADPVAAKEDVAFYFIDRMQSVIDGIPIKSFIGLHYKAEGWGKGFNDAYVKYKDLVIKYEKIRKNRG